MTSSNGNIFHVTGPLCGEFTGHRWIPRTKASDAELRCFLWSAPERGVKGQVIVAVALTMTPIRRHSSACPIQCRALHRLLVHYSDVIMSATVSEITSLSTVCSATNKHTSKRTSTLSVAGLCEGNPPVAHGSPHKGPVTQKMFPFDDVILLIGTAENDIGMKTTSFSKFTKMLWACPLQNVDRFWT